MEWPCLLGTAPCPRAAQQLSNYSLFREEWHLSPGYWWQNCHVAGDGIELYHVIFSSVFTQKEIMFALKRHGNKKLILESWEYHPPSAADIQTFTLLVVINFFVQGNPLSPLVIAASYIFYWCYTSRFCHSNSNKNYMLNWKCFMVLTVDKIC